MTAFTCQRCGNCCRVPGQVILAPGEAERIAGHLGIDIYTFTEFYTTLRAGRNGLILTEQPGGACIFLTPESGCRVQPVKPRQCIGYPGAWRSEAIENVCQARSKGTPA